MAGNQLLSWFKRVFVRHGSQKQPAQPRPSSDIGGKRVPDEQDRADSQERAQLTISTQSHAGEKQKIRARLNSRIHEIRQLERDGNFVGALAICEGLPPELRNDPAVLYRQGLLFERIGRFNAAYDKFQALLAFKPRHDRAWTRAATMLARLGLRNELSNLIDKMLSTLPVNAESLMRAAATARTGNLHALARKLSEQAMSMDPTPAEILGEARVLLRQGEQGRAISLLDRKFASSDMGLNIEAADLRDLALAQLRAAGRSSSCGSVNEGERADVLAVRSILEQGGALTAAVTPVKGRIAIVMHSLGPGGIQRQIVRLLEQHCTIPDARVESICVLLLATSKTAPDFRWDALANLKVTIESYSETAADLENLVDPGTTERLSVFPTTQSRRIVHLIGMLHRHRPEIIIAMGETNGLAAILAGSILGTPRIVISGRGEPPPARSLYDELLKPAYQIALARDKLSLVTNSVTTARHFNDWLGIPHIRIGVIYNGVDVDQMRAGRDPAATTAHRRSLGIPESARVVGSIFNARREKRPHLWIAAAAAVATRAPDIHFVLVGGGHWMNDVPYLLPRYGLQGRVHTLGIRKDVATWFELMDVVLLTSENEGTPNVLLEAQSLGRPVVATDVGGNAETFVPGETGILLSADPTPEEVADAVMSVLNDSAFALRAQLRAPDFIRDRFDSKRMAAEFMDLCFGREGR